MRKGFIFLTLIPLTIAAFSSVSVAGANGGEVTFTIKEFLLEGNTIFSADQLQKALKPFIGQKKTSKDVEAARSAVEKYYHEKGYPTALVNIPQQSIEDATVRLEVIESKIRRVRVKGNRYFTRERLLKEMPAFRPGEILYLPNVKSQLARVNRNPDLKVAPVLMPGKKLGTIDVEFRVKDKLPLHGSLELNNRSSHDTTDLRANAALRYDNLWQKEHSLGLQYQTSPEDTEEVALVTGTYNMPSFIDDDHMIALYGVWSDSDTATADDIQVIGSGTIFGGRYMMNLEPLESYLHNLTLGMDFKDFDEDIEGDKKPVRYLLWGASYNGIIPDKGGQTQFGFGLNAAFRSLGSDEDAFDVKRRGAKGSFLYFTAQLERLQKLGGGFHLLMAVNGQLASQPLISNEQYSAGGIYDVRGYKQSELSGDNAVRGTVEISSPDLGQLMGISKHLEMTPYIFYDMAALETKDPLPGEEPNEMIQGAGAGVRGYMFKHLAYQLDWAMALEGTDRIDSGASTVHFVIRYEF